MSDRSQSLDTLELQRQHWAMTLKSLEQTATELSPVRRDLADMAIAEAHLALETLADKCLQAQAADESHWPALQAELAVLSDSAGTMLRNVDKAISSTGRS